MSEPTSSQVIDRATSKNKKRMNAHDEVLLHIMLEMHHEGKTIPAGFATEGWCLITKEMQIKYEPKHTKDKLNNRFESLKKWYSTMKSTLILSGSG